MSFDHEVIVVAERRERQLGQRDAIVAVRCKTCCIHTSERVVEYRTLWVGDVLPASLLDMIIDEHNHEGRAADVPRETVVESS
jgi:hypothetical protein